MLRGPSLVILCLICSMPACSGGAVNRAWDTQYDFGALSTYDWAAKEPEELPGLSYDLIDRAVRRSVERHMSAAGFSRAAEAPSFRVTYYLGVEAVSRITDAGYYGRGWGGYWGYGWYGPDGLNVSLYDEGTLTIDVLSPEPGIGLVWRGIARGQFDAQLSPRRLERAIDDAVQEILEEFPPEQDER